MISIKAKYKADDRLRYCPDWAASRKAGRPKKNEKRKPGVMDAIAKKKRRKVLWCDICHKFNHNTRDCYKNQSAEDLATVMEIPLGEMSDEGKTGEI